MQPTSAPTSVCLVRLSALGDVVLATALVGTLRAAWPDLRITWVTSGVTRELLGGLPGIEWIEVPRPMGAAAWLGLRRRLAGRRFDVLLAAQASFRANLVHAAVRADRRIGFDAARARDLHGWFVGERIAPQDGHLAEGFLGFATALGIPPERQVRRLEVPLTAEDWAAARALTGGGRYFVVNPSASKAERNWRADRYAAVAGHAARRHGWRIIITGGGGPAERALAAEVAARTGPATLDLSGRTRVRELAAILAGAEGLLAPDTGPVHLAAAAGTPVVGLYAVARSALTGPWPDRAFCVDRYDEAARTLLGDPAPAWHRRVHDPRAMDLITVDEVCAQVDRLAATRAGTG